MVDRLKENWETEIRRGVLQLLVCAVLEEEDLHGIGICDNIFMKTGSIIQVPLGTIYPLLKRYIQEELIETYKPKEDQRKTIYKLNASGKEFYLYMQETWNRYSAAVSEILHPRKDIGVDRNN
jgi:PadR family transcriptional regulator, regulatory protein PadR